MPKSQQSSSIIISPLSQLGGGCPSRWVRRSVPVGLSRSRWVRSVRWQLALPLGLNVAAVACSPSEEPNPAQLSEAADSAPLGENSDTLFGVHAARPAKTLSPIERGKELFTKPFKDTNGRSCATCHVLSEATALLPASVEQRLEHAPTDPLFQALDADDPEAPMLTFEHLKKGLVRVVLPLPDNMDVIDEAGSVITPADRKIFVWRGVPSVADVAFTAPYQLDGRAATLEEQAQGAISSHSQGPQVPQKDLEHIAAFERSIFSSARAEQVAELLARGLSPMETPPPELSMPLGAAQRRGLEVYAQACAPCHGGTTTNRIEDRAVRELFFFELTPEGNVRFESEGDGPPTPVLADRPESEFLNVGFGALSVFGQLGVAPTFNADVELPRYRFRFYSDASRQEQVTDLPPLPVTESGDPLDPRPAVDESGAPIAGPALVPQPFSTDPGRAVITGDPADFEAFDVPSLRGIAATAPYYHDNSMGTLRDVIDAYSRTVIGELPPLNLPAILPPEQPGLPPESLSAEQKADLLEFLQML